MTVTTDDYGCRCPRVTPGASATSVAGGRFILAAGDTSSLIVAYAITLLVSEQIGPLPAVSAPGWFLALVGVTAVPIWLGIFTAYHLYDNDSQRISVASFDEVQDLFHAILAGSLGFLILSQGVSHLAGLVDLQRRRGVHLRRIGACADSDRSRVDPQLDPPPRDEATADADRRRAAARPASFIGSSRHTRSTASTSSDSSAARPTEGRVPGPVLGSHEDIATTRRRAGHRPDPPRVGGRQSRRDARSRPYRAAPRRPGVDRPALLRDLHLPRDPRRGRGHAGRDTGADEPRTKLASAEALLRLHRVRSRTARSSLPCSRRSRSRSSSTHAAPALYRQPRRGRYGSTFSIVKFRTMRIGAEQDRATVLHMNEVDGPLFKIKGVDPRVTRVGSFLRRTSLDELPQLWNVLKGEMSLVGPRPFVVYEADQIQGWALRRLDMTPGHHGALADPRAKRHALRRDDEARLSVRHELVGLVGPQDPLPDDSGRPGQARRVLAASRGRRSLRIVSADTTVAQSTRARARLTAIRDHTASRAVIAARADVLALTGLIGLVAALTVVTWGTWGDLDSDTGFDVQAGDRIADGQIPYRDFIYYYGPLAPFLTAAAALVGRSRIRAGDPARLPDHAGDHRGDVCGHTDLAGPLAALIASAITAAVAFIPDDYNYVLPHTGDATLGTLILLGVLLAVRRYAVSASPRWSLAIGSLLGLLALTKPEPAIAGFVGVATWLARAAARRHRVPRGDHSRRGAGRVDSRAGLREFHGDRHAPSPSLREPVPP